MTVNVFARASLLSLLAASPTLASDAHWEYGAGHGGPSHWSDLSPDFSSCGLGKHQSPIDIRHATKAELPPIQFAYKAGEAAEVNNGHTIQVNVPAGSSITVGDHTYALVQFHFHTPSEEAVSGKRAAMVAHFVHKDAEGKLAVVAVLLDVGGEDAALAPVFGHMPARADPKAPTPVQVDPSAVLPAGHAYYSFEGSLTTPPCSEGVRWFVLQQHATLSKAQLAAFRKLYPANARPLQPLNDREVLASQGAP